MIALDRYVRRFMRLFIKQISIVIFIYLGFGSFYSFCLLNNNEICDPEEIHRTDPDRVFILVKVLIKVKPGRKQFRSRVHRNPIVLLPPGRYP